MFLGFHYLKIPSLCFISCPCKLKREGARNEGFFSLELKYKQDFISEQCTTHKYTGFYFQTTDPPRGDALTIAHLHSQIQEMFDHTDLSIGGCGVQGGVTLLILTRHFCVMVNEQCHNVQVAFRKQAVENSINLYRTI